MLENRKKIPLKNSISFRLSFRFMLIVAGIVLLLSFSFVFLLRYSISSRQKQDLYTTTDILVENFRSSENLEPELLQIPYFISYLIYSTNDETTLFTNDPFIPKLPVTKNKAKSYFQKDFFADGNLHILYSSTELAEQKIVIQTSIDVERDFANEMIQEIPRLVLITILPILIISFLISLLITKRTIRPVEKITDSAAAMSSTNLEHMLPVTSRNDELDYLAKTFNKLFENLKKDFEQERNFTSNVSHELKTPIAGILGQTKLLQRWGKEDPKQLEQSLGLIATEAESMNSIITNLLQISKLETGHEQIFKEHIDFQILFDRLKNEFRTISENTEITYECEDGLNFATDSELLHQVLTALISNSIKFYKPEDGKNCQIKLTALKAGNKIVVQESDNGPGIANDVLPHIFERFYRGDPSHNRGAGGAGLGLSISASIIAALGGTIKAENKTEESGVIFMLEF